MNRYNIMSVIAFFAIVVMIYSCGNNPESNTVLYPDGYRNWTHVKSMIILPGHQLYGAFGGIHHLYANDKALEGYMDGGTFPDGSVIVFDLLETVETDNAITEANRKVVGVMQKNSELFAETGGWGFEGFKGDTQERVVQNMKADCYSCHLSEEKSDFVFSKYRK